MSETLKKILKKALKVVKWLAIVIGVLWVIILVVLQLMLTERFLRSAADKYLPEVIEGADVTFAHINASVIKSFPNLRLDIDSLCITYPHERWAAYDSLPGVRSRLAHVGRGPEKDTLACFSNISVSVSYIAFLKGTISLSDISLKDSRIFARQFDSTEANWNVFRFMQAAPDTTAVAADEEPSDVVFHHIGLNGRTFAIYANSADTVFAAVGSRHIDVDGTIALQDIFGSKVRVQVDSTFVSGRTATDTISAGFKHLTVGRRRGYHHINADAAAFLAMGGSGRMMLPMKLDALLKFPDKNAEKIKIKDLRLNLASFSMKGEADLHFLEDSLGIRAKAAIDTCDATRLLKDFAALIGPEAKKIKTNAELSMDLECDGYMRYEPFRLPQITGHLRIPESTVKHADVQEAGKLAADIILTSNNKGYTTATAEKLLISFAGVDLNGKCVAKDVMGDDPLLNLDAKAAIDLKKLSVFLPDDMTALGRVDARLKGSAKVSEFGPGRFAGANLDGFLRSEGLTLQDSTLMAYLGNTDVQLKKKPRTKGSSGEYRLIVEGQIDSVYAAIGPVTRIRGKALNISLSDVDASIHAQRISMVGEDSLFVALRNSNNYISISKHKEDDSKMNSISVSSDNEGFFLRSGRQVLGLRGAQLTTSGTRQVADAKRISRREKMLDSLQRIWPGVPRDSLFYKMMRQRMAERGGHSFQIPDYMRDKSFRTQDISFRLEDELAQYFKEWSLDGFINVERGFAATPAFPLRTRINALQGRFNNNEVIVDSIGIKSGKSEISAHAKLSGLRRALLGRGTVKLDANIYSRTMDANEIFAALDAGQRYAEAHAGETVGVETEASESSYLTSDLDTTASMPLIVVPANLNVSIGIQGDTIHYATLLIDSFRSKILMKERCLQVSGTTATSNMGRISLEGFYSTKSRQDISVGFDLNLNDITGEKVITLIPQVDTLLPLLKSFKGMLDCEFAATSALDTNMNFKTETINGLMQINGRNLTVEQDKAVRKITRLLMFKNKKTGVVDEMSVKGVVGDNQLEIFPFNLKVDRYKLALGGQHSFDGDFKYHISVLKSPIPWKFGINISGNADKWKWRFGGAKYKKIDTPVYTRQLDTARTNLLSSIRNIFDKGVSLALEQSREQLSEIRERLDVGGEGTVSDTIRTKGLVVPDDDDADTLSAAQLLQMDSMIVANDSLEIRDSLRLIDSLRIRDSLKLVEPVKLD